MAKRTILLITTQSAGISASQIRMKYFRQSLENQGYNIVNFEINLNGLNKYLCYFSRSPPKSLSTASKDVDLVIATSPTLINAIFGYKIAEGQGLPLIVDIRDLWEEYAKTAHFLMYHLGVIKKIVKDYHKALKYSSKIFVVTEPMKQYYEKNLGIKNKVVVISNGTDVSIIKCDENVKQQQDLVYLADLNRPYHNLEFLFAALKDNNLRLMVIGGGKYLSKMKRKTQNFKIDNRVSFVGWVLYENLATYLCKARVGVVGRPFVNNIEYLYTIPVKIYDYLAAGLPVAGYGPKNSAIEEFIKKNGIGTFVSQIDPNNLSDELTKLVKGFDNYTKKARQIALNFDRKKLAQKMVDIVNGILD